jgi:dCTP deaminase
MNERSFSPPAGLLPSQWIHNAVDLGIVHSRYQIVESQFQPASLDLRLGEEAFRLRSSFLPERETVEQKLRSQVLHRVDLVHGGVLERNTPYLIPLLEELDLPPSLSAKSNPRSSTGRLDIFTRVISDRSRSFDEISPGYRGKLYLEVVSRSFTIKVKRELALNQLRLFHTKLPVGDDELSRLHSSTPLLSIEGRPIPELTTKGGLFLSVDLDGDDTGRIGFKAKKNSHLLDLTRDARYEPGLFWESVRAEEGKRIVLEPEEFYLLISLEGVTIPPQYAAEMVAYEPTSGELRTHYAGFFDPGFGFVQGAEAQGTKAALEVRAHDVPFMLEHGQRVCKLAFERMAEEPAILYGPEIGSAYQGQVGTLSRFFLPLASDRAVQAAF